MRWIPVKDAPDQKLGLVWVSDGGYDRCGAVAFGRVHHFASDGYSHAVAIGLKGNFKITHWMPFPAGPEAGEQG